MIQQQLSYLTENMKTLIELQNNKTNTELEKAKKNCETLDEIQPYSSKDLDEEVLHEAIKHSRSIDVVIKLLGPEFKLADEGIRCSCCGVTFSNNLELGKKKNIFSWSQI